MGFQVKYFYTFRDINDLQYKVEILEDTTDVLIPVELIPDTDPFMIEYPTANKFAPVLGSGCDMNLISATDRQLFDLYTAEIQKYMIKLYDNELNLIYSAWLDTELYREDFSYLDNYPISFSGSDLSVLDRLNFVDASKNDYKGIKSKWDILNIIITEKLKLPIANIYVGLSTVIYGENYDNIAANLLSNSYVYCANYYDEDDVPFTCRKVLEEILRPYVASFQIVNNNIYIFDYNTLLSATPIFKKYTSAMAYMADVTLNCNLGDLSIIKFASSKQNLGVDPAINKQVVKYSPYSESKLLELKLDDLAILTPFRVDNKGTGTEYCWTETLYKDNSELTWVDNTTAKAYIAKSQGTGTQNSKTSDIYLKFERALQTGQTNWAAQQDFRPVYRLKKNLGYILGSDLNTNYLKIECEAYVNTLNNLGDTLEESDYSDRIRGLYIPVMIWTDNYDDYMENDSISFTEMLRDWGKIIDAMKPYADVTTGMITYEGNTYPWSYSFLNFYNEKRATSIANNWVSIRQTIRQFGPNKDLGKGELIPLKSGISGILNFCFLQGIQIFDDIGSDVSINMNDVRIRNLKITVIDGNGNEIENSDIEYPACLDPNYKNEGKKVVVLHGTNVNNNSTAKGTLLGKDSTGAYYFIKQWTRGGKTFNVESLLLRSIVSNFTFSNITLTCDLNKVQGLGYLTFANYLAGKKFILRSHKINYAESVSSVSLIEISADNLDVKTSYT
jgi:hypothetical protein